MRVSEAIKCFLDYHRMNSKTNTVRNYELVLSRFVVNLVTGSWSLQAQMRFWHSSPSLPKEPNSQPNDYVIHFFQPSSVS